MISPDKINEARQNGYSNAEITDFLGQQGYQDKINEARKSGYSDDEIISHLGQKAPQSFQEKSQEIGSNLARGTAKGLGNALVGAIQAPTDLGEKAAQLIEKLYFGDNIPVDTFGKRLARQVKKGEEEEAALPISEKVGIEIGKTLPYLVAGAGTGIKVATATGKKILGMAVGSAIGGAEQGALSPQAEADLGNRGIETLKGGGTGAIVGTGLGLASKVVGAAIPAVKKLFTAQSAQDVLAARLPKEQTVELLEQLKTATPDNPVLLPDIAGDSIKGLTRSVAKIPVARDLVKDVLEKRSQGAISRVADQLARDVSPVENYFQNLDDLKAGRKAVAQPLYEKSFAENPKLSPEINKELFDKLAPEIKSARKDFRLTKEEAPDNSLVLLDKVKQSLYDKSQALKRGGQSNQAGVFDDLRVQLTQRLKDASPDYAKALRVFEDDSKFITAQQKGLQFSKLRPEEIRREVKKMSPGERDAYRIGVRENQMKVVSSTNDGADPATRIFGNQFKREQLKAVFGNKTKFSDFEKKMNLEIAAADTKAEVLGGSRTDYNQAGDEQFLGQIVKAGSTVAKSKTNPLYLIDATYNALSNKFAGINKNNAKEIAESLVNRKMSIEVLDNIIKKQTNPLQKKAVLEAKDFILSNLLTKTTGNNDTNPTDNQYR